MLQSKRNELTESILGKLRKKGVPQQSPIEEQLQDPFSDMYHGAPGTGGEISEEGVTQPAEQESDDLLQISQGPRKRKKPLLPG